MHAGRKRSICYNTARSGSFIALHITSILCEREDLAPSLFSRLSLSLSASLKLLQTVFYKKNIFIDYVTQWNIQIFQSDFGNL